MKSGPVTSSSPGDDQRSLRAFIQKECGIKMPPAKRVMLEARLQKRLRALGITTLKDYREYLLTDAGRNGELIHCIDAVTTNKTDFFREPSHFDYLAAQALPSLIDAGAGRERKRITVWSAGCSTGEEPYTLAMVLSEFAETRPGFDFKVLATDISTRALEKAWLAVYDRERAAPIPEKLKAKYLLRSKDSSKNLVRIAPWIREKVAFQRLNFMEDRFSIRDKIDVIFCRNVIIYFDRPTQEQLMNKFCRHLGPGGYLFLGHSETIHNMDVPLVATAPTIYRRPQ
ncbi:MAG: chemotaxis protein CheR [Nitrospirota bacterium]|nr:chemotaxis protein CheR [Nitrospirota bacterium]